MAGFHEDALANALPWLPRGMRIGPFRGPPMWTMRPRTLLRPMSPSAMLPGPPFADLAQPPTQQTIAQPARTIAQLGIALTEQRAVKRRREEEDARGKAMAVFADLLARFPLLFAITEKMVASGEGIVADAPSLVSALASRKTATLRKRAGSLRLFVRWFASCERDPAELLADKTLLSTWGSSLRSAPAAPQAWRSPRR